MKRSVSELEHLSKSSIESYADCGWYWKDKYLEGRRSPTTPALLLGSAFDQVVEQYLRVATLKADWRPSLHHLWESAWRETSTGERAESIDWQGELPEQVANVGARLVNHPGTKQLLDRLKVKVDEAHGPWLQRPISLRVPGVGVPIIGYLDLVEADGVPGDIKTAGRAWDTDKPRRELQPRIYLAGLLQEGYDVPRGPGGGYLFRHYVWLKTRETRIQEFTTEFSAASIAQGVLAALHSWKGIKAGVFLKNSSSWRCGEKFCPAWAECMGLVK